MVTPGARKTPRGARPNRRGEPARLAEHIFQRRCAPFAAARAAANCEPSGRLLESRCEPWPRGMIAAAHNSPRELCARQNPAYRLARHFSQCFWRFFEGSTSRLTCLTSLTKFICQSLAIHAGKADYLVTGRQERVAGACQLQVHANHDGARVCCHGFSRPP